MTVPLVAVAHGSRDPRSAASVRRLVARVREGSPGLDTRVAFLDLSEPALGDVLAELYRAGHREAVVVPLLLGRAFHADVDVPAAVSRVAERLPLSRVSVSDVLGPDRLLQRAALARLAQAGAGPDDGTGVVLTGVGSAHSPANAAVARLAARWHRESGYAAVTHAFATCDPSVESALARLRAQGARRVALVPWFLAPGLLLDRVTARAAAAAPDLAVAAPLGDHPLVAELVLRRYAATTARRLRAA